MRTNHLNYIGLRTYDSLYHLPSRPFTNLSQLLALLFWLATYGLIVMYGFFRIAPYGLTLQRIENLFSQYFVLQNVHLELSDTDVGPSVVVSTAECVIPRLEIALADLDGSERIAENVS